jgi:hypothetical protein
MAPVSTILLQEIVLSPLNQRAFFLVPRSSLMQVMGKSHRLATLVPSAVHATDMRDAGEVCHGTPTDFPSSNAVTLGPILGFARLTGGHFFIRARLAHGRRRTKMEDSTG